MHIEYVSGWCFFLLVKQIIYNTMNNYEITFLHTDGTTRIVEIEAYNEERARMRFHVNWDKEMKIITVKQKQ